MSIEITPAFEKAMQLMEQGNENVFITGKAGTGKSTLLKHFKEHTSKNIVLLAPTGVAAVNIGGQTIHSFFKFQPSTTLNTVRRYTGKPSENIYKKIDAMVIDEISMVRADLLDCIDRSMRLNGRDPKLPFGGVQLIFFGDMYQLPPVVPHMERHLFENYYKSPYFFSAGAFQDVAFEKVELDKIYRQQDQKFIDLLNSIRGGQCSSEDLRLVNQRLDLDFRVTPDNPYIYLTPRNQKATEVNEHMLNQLKARTHSFEAEIKGKFGKEYYPAPFELQLKEGARVMMTNNDANKRWTNGTMGTVMRIQPKAIQVKLDNGEFYDVKQHTWEITKFILEDGRIDAAPIGRFKQFPMMLAWAMTIHKSQGKTFDKVLLDLEHGAFSPGQVYVALSRCTSLEGIVLTRPIQQRNIWVDQVVEKFIAS
ncbi:MAG: AAA family ATPase [Alphaproteobacteria bacterium]|nr:MAG: AAA family ATPase [Alphaproteobacteria bacterium]